jgi:hypothetical protein
MTAQLDAAFTSTLKTCDRYLVISVSGSGRCSWATASTTRQAFGQLPPDEVS